MIIKDFPSTSDLNFLKSNTIVAIQHPCDKIITRTTVGEIMDKMNGQLKKRDVTKWDLITEQHRLDLCDIYWWLMGLKAGGDHTFSNQMQRLKDVIEALRDKNNG